jgi:iron complex outermembrane receptor protein
MILRLCPVAVVIGALLALAGSSAAAGEPEEEKEVPTIEVVVTATRTPQAVADVPASVTVITEEDIEVSGAKKIDDIIRLIAGIDVQRSFGVVTMSPTVSMRGMGDQPGRTLVMIDGVPANKADTGNFLWNRINLADVERVEVVRGAASALYGSHAMGGVINIITKRPTEKPETTIRTETGSLDTQRAQLLTRGTAGRLGYVIAGGWLDSAGYDPVPANSEERTEYTIPRDAEENMFRVSLAPEAGDAELLMNFSRFADERGEGERIQDPRGVYRSFDTQQLDLAYDRTVGGTDWLLKLYDIGEDYFWNREQVRKGVYTRYEVNVDRTERGALLQGSHQLRSRARLTAGVDYKLGEVDGSDDYKEGPDAGLRVTNQGKQQIVGLFAQYDVPFSQGRGRAILGGRYDWADVYNARFVDETGFLPNGPLPGGGWPDSDWSAFSPKAGLIYHAAPGTDLRVNIGRAFRSPILDDLFRSGIFRGRYYRANPDLQPETVWTYEAGVEHRPRPNTRLRLTGYWSDADDFFYAILVDPDFDPKPLYERRNVAAARMRGIEGEVEHRCSPTLSAFANVVWNKSTIEKFARLSPDDPDLTGKELEFAPRWKLNGGLRCRGSNGWRGQIAGRVVDEQFANPDNTAKIDRYFVVDLTLERELQEEWQLAFEVRNVFDRQFLEGDYYESTNGIWTNRTDPADPSSPLLSDVVLDPGRLVTFVVRRTF